MLCLVLTQVYGREHPLHVLAEARQLVRMNHEDESSTSALRAAMLVRMITSIADRWHMFMPFLLGIEQPQYSHYRTVM